MEAWRDDRGLFRKIEPAPEGRLYGISGGVKPEVEEIAEEDNDNLERGEQGREREANGKYGLSIAFV